MSKHCAPTAFTGNVSGDDHVALVAVDYGHQRRLKIFGHARIVTADEGPALIDRLTAPDHDVVIERAVVVVDVAAYDWNRPQRITPRFTVAELQPALESMRHQLAASEAGSARLRGAESREVP